jgi:adenine/guanine phosphoribosyltransferase-like PRPP-binding protein
LASLTSLVNQTLSADIETALAVSPDAAFLPLNLFAYPDLLRRSCDEVLRPWRQAPDGVVAVSRLGLPLCVSLAYFTYQRFGRFPAIASLDVEDHAPSSPLTLSNSLLQKQVVLCDDLIRDGYHLSQCVRGIRNMCTILEVVVVLDNTFGHLRSKYLEPLVSETGLQIRALARLEA